MLTAHKSECAGRAYDSGIPEVFDMRNQPISRQAKSVPYRNFMCEKYDDCLAHAAYSNKSKLPCAKCKDMAAAGKVGKISEIPRIHKKATTVEAGCVGSAKASKLLGIPLSRLHSMRYSGEGPEHIIPEEPGGPILYEISALHRYLEACANTPAPVATEVSTPIAAEMIGISVGYLGKMRNMKKGPPWRKVGERYLYSVKGIEEYNRAMAT